MNIHHSDERPVFLRHTINGYKLPKRVVATRAGPNAPLCEGNDRDIHHNHWALSEQVGRHLEKIVWVNFDSVVDEGGVRLTAPHLKADYTMKKVLVLNALGAGANKAKNNKVITLLSSTYDRHVRWRLAKGIPQNEDIRKHHFDDWVSCLSKTPLDFIPVQLRLERVIGKIHSGDLDLAQFYRAPSRSSKPKFDWDRFAKLMGTTVKLLSTSRAFVAELVDQLAGIDHPRTKELVVALFRDDREVEEGYSIETAKKYLMFWSELSRVSRLGSVPAGNLNFDPFQKRSLVSTLRSVNVKASKRTATLHPDDFVRILREAAKWAFEYSAYILEAVEERRKLTNNNWKEHKAPFISHFDKIRPDGAPKLHHGWYISQYETEARSEQRLGLGDAVKHLLTACAIIIACFSARRGGEIEMLLSDCITKRGKLNFLTVYIEKTLQRIDKIPVPEMVAGAVDILKKTIGDVDGAPKSLFLVLKHEFPVNFAFTRNIQAFVAYSKLDPPEGQDAWDLSSHQFRRGFAVFYYYGNDWSQLDPLAHMFRHYDPEMTRIYITEAVVGAIGGLQDELRARLNVARGMRSKELREWLAKTEQRISDLKEIVAEFDETRSEAFVYRMIAMRKGIERPIGFGVKRLQIDLEQLVEEAAAEVRVTSGANDGDKFDQAFEKCVKNYVAQRSLEPVPGRAAHCNANLDGSDDLTQAECNKLAAAGNSPMPHPTSTRSNLVNLGFSGAYPCLTCIYGVLFNADQRRLDEKISAVAESVETAPTESIKQASKAKFERLVLARRAASETARSA